MTGPVEGSGQPHKPQQPNINQPSDPNEFKAKTNTQSAQKPDTDRNDQAWVKSLQALFPGHTFNKQEVKEFQKVIMLQVSNAVKKSMQIAKKAAERLKRAEEGKGI